MEAYREQIVVQTQEGVDLLVAETMLGVTECMAVLDAAASVCNLPVMCTLTVESDGSLFFVILRSPLLLVFPLPFLLSTL